MDTPEHCRCRLRGRRTGRPRGGTPRRWAGTYPLGTRRKIRCNGPPRRIARRLPGGRFLSRAQMYNPPCSTNRSIHWRPRLHRTARRYLSSRCRSLKIPDMCPGYTDQSNKRPGRRMVDLVVCRRMQRSYHSRILGNSSRYWRRTAAHWADRKVSTNHHRIFHYNIHHRYCISHRRSNSILPCQSY